jgi:hypothetical protein
MHMWKVQKIDIQKNWFGPKKFGKGRQANFRLKPIKLSTLVWKPSLWLVVACLFNFGECLESCLCFVVFYFFIHWFFVFKVVGLQVGFCYICKMHWHFEVLLLYVIVNSAALHNHILSYRTWAICEMVVKVLSLNIKLVMFWTKVKGIGSLERCLVINHLYISWFSPRPCILWLFLITWWT